MAGGDVVQNCQFFLTHSSFLISQAMADVPISAPSKKGDVVDYVELLYSTLLPVACFTPRFSAGKTHHQSMSRR
jgi:hypothetical protein